MKIAVYKDNLSTGRGADTAVKNFASALKELGYDTELFDKTQLQSRLECDFDIVVITGSNEAVDLDRLGYFSRPSRGKVILQLHLALKGFFK